MRHLLSVLICSICFATTVWAHPMPHSVMMLDVKSDGITAELQWPLKEFQLVFPDTDIDSHPYTLIDRKGQWLDDYLLHHLSITSPDGTAWTIAINNKQVSKAEQTLTGAYQELTFSLWFRPPAGESPRHFTMHYDAIMHQLVTHKMFIRIRRDWDGGLSEKDSLDEDLGVLMVNTSDNSIPPVVVNLDEGSLWKGFKSMVSLGITHIAEGTDHLLFLLVLVLPSTLVVVNKRWGGYGGMRYSLIRLLKTVTAFTLGHSVSLLLGSLKWVVLPQQPVEIAIGFTILITAIHALIPLFEGKEAYIAAFFGLIHGLAFSTAIADLNLDSGRMALSILGFNIGIELMQLFVILCTMPWLIIISKNGLYSWLRIGGSLIALVASIGWIVERFVDRPNFVSLTVEHIATHSEWVLMFLAAMALVSMGYHQYRSPHFR